MPPPDWFKKANPFVLVYAPYAWPGYVAPSDVAIFVAVVLLLSTALVARTIAMVRRNVLEPIRRVQDVAAAGKFRLSRWLEWLPGPSLDGNPVLWREWHRNRPSRWMRIIWTIYVVTTVVGVGTRDPRIDQVRPGRSERFVRDRHGGTLSIPLRPLDHEQRGADVARRRAGPGQS